MTDAMFAGLVATCLGLLTLFLAAWEWDAMKGRGRRRSVMRCTGPVGLCLFFGIPPLFVALGLSIVLLEAFL